MDINNLTIGQAKELASLFGGRNSQDTAFEVGKSYFIRTATYHVIGRLSEIYPNELVLSDASWVADSGRFHDALKTGDLAEVEPFVTNAIVSRGGIIDATDWNHSLPSEQK